MKRLTIAALNTETVQRIASAPDSSTVKLRIKDTGIGLGTRGHGRQLRTLVENIIRNDRREVVLDFDGVEICSSAFLDELVCKLVMEYGFMGFSRNVRLAHVTATNELLINHSLMQRLAEQQPLTAQSTTL